MLDESGFRRPHLDVSCSTDAWITPPVQPNPLSRSSAPCLRSLRTVRSVARCCHSLLKDRPSTVSRSEESAARVDVAARVSPPECRHLSVAIFASRSGCQPALRSAFVVRPPWRFLLPEPARVLHRAPVLGFEMFPRVLLALAWLPKQPYLRALTALPHLALSALRSLSPRPEQALPIARPTPGSRHPRRSPGPVHREPCPLVLHRVRGGDLGAFLPVRSPGSLRRCRPRAPAAPLGLPGSP